MTNELVKRPLIKKIRKVFLSNWRLYVYKTGLQNVQYSLSTAVGLMNSLVNFVLLIVSNTVAKKVSGYGFF